MDLERSVNLMLYAKPEAATGCWEALVDYDSHRQPLTDVSALVVSGIRAANDDTLIDELLPLAVTEHLDTGSFVQLEVPDRVTHLIAKFVAQSHDAA